MAIVNRERKIKFRLHTLKYVIPYVCAYLAHFKPFLEAFFLYLSLLYFLCVCMDLTFFPVLADSKACLAQHPLPRSIILFILQVISNFVLSSFHYYRQGISFLYKNGIVYINVEPHTVPKPYLQL